MTRFIDLTGEAFGRLEVLGCVPRNERPNRYAVYWFCQCRCGNKTIVRADALRSGHTSSCGCLHGPNGLDDAERTARTELQRIAVALEALVAHTLGSKAM